MVALGNKSIATYLNFGRATLPAKSEMKSYTQVALEALFWRMFLVSLHLPLPLHHVVYDDLIAIGPKTP